MGKTLIYKILEQHLVEGRLVPGEEIGIRIDQTLTQDATGTTAFLLFESMGVGRVRTDLSVSYVDHNMAGSGRRTTTTTCTCRPSPPGAGVYHRRPGNGICHQVHLERFGKPGTTLLGSDSHTPTGGGIGMLAIGAGGLDVAVAMGGGPFYLHCPKVIGVEADRQARRLGGRQGRHPAAAEHPDDQGQRRLRGRVLRRGRQEPDRAAAGDDHEHGRRTGRDDQHLRQRRADAKIPRRTETRAGLPARWRRTRTPSTTG